MHVLYISVIAYCGIINQLTSGRPRPTVFKISIIRNKTSVLFLNNSL